jgi:hypothetical protein
LEGKKLGNLGCLASNNMFFLALEKKLQNQLRKAGGK